MIRLAEAKDSAAIAASYDALLRYEAVHGTQSGWRRGIYPTAAVPEEKIPRGEMYVLEENGEVCASLVLNEEQPPEYAGIAWAQGGRALVLHTLCVPPAAQGRGYGGQLVHFAQEVAWARGARSLRLDTWAGNLPAQRLYAKRGFRLAGRGHMLLAGRIPEEQVYYEWQVGEA